MRSLEDTSLNIYFNFKLGSLERNREKKKKGYSFLNRIHVQTVFAKVLQIFFFYVGFLALKNNSQLLHDLVSLKVNTD